MFDLPNAKRCGSPRHVSQGPYIAPLLEAGHFARTAPFFANCLSRVRRDELMDSSSGSGSEREERSVGGLDKAQEAAVRAKLEAHVSRVLALGLPAQQPAAGGGGGGSGGGGDGGSETQGQGGDPPSQPDQEKEEEEFAFRLFSTSTAAPKVVLAADDGSGTTAGQGGFVVPSRPLSYYLAQEPTEDEMERYRSSAVRGEDVVRRSGQRRWGLEVPWRVTTITVSHKQLKALSGKSPQQQAGETAGGDEDDEAAPPPEKKRRPGKKRRIALHIKGRARKEELLQEEMRKASKEEHVKEKKKRLNREKKLKRRQKERDKKSGAKAEGEGEASSGIADAADGGGGGASPSADGGDNSS